MSDAAARHLRLRALFDAALAREPALRAGYLDALCSDDRDLQAEVARLLAAHDQAHAFLEHPAARLLPLPVPAVFRGNARFTVLRTLGIGGMGVVYEVHDTIRDEVVALKTLLHTGAADIYRLKREFRTLADVAHVNLVCLYELFVEDTHAFFTMELVRGTSFVEWVRAESSPSGREARLLAAFAQLVAGVSALHQAGKLHRDIKPSNILVTEAGRVVILDFGLITELRSTEIDLGVGAGGTPAYMSPEEVAGAAPSAASDWYSVGATMYEALTGDVPVTGTPLEVLQRKTAIDPVSPREIVPSLSAALDAACVGLLRRDPRHRLTGHEALAQLQGGGSDSTGRSRGSRSVGSRSDSSSDSSGGGSSDSSDSSSDGHVEMPRRERVMVSPREAPFVGRARELEILGAQFERARRGEAPVVMVSGVSGIGKSALIRAFLARCAARAEGVILPGRCYEHESVPYKAVDGVIDSMSRHLCTLPRDDARAQLPRDVHALTRLFPVLLQAPAVADACADADEDLSASDPIALRRRALAALRELLVRLAAVQPLIVWIDDLQWSDDDSAVVLDELLRAPGPPGLLTILCARGSGSSSSSGGRAASDAIAIDLQPIEAADASALVRAFVREAAPVGLDPGVDPGLDLERDLDRDIDADMTSAIVEESAGNPFLIEQLARHVIARDCDPRERAAGEGGRARRRPTFAEVLDHQLRTLPADGRRLLEALVVCGRPMTPSIVAAAATITGELRPLLALLRAAHVIRGSGSGSGSGSRSASGTADAEHIETYHDRVRESIASTLSADAARDIHLRMAETLIAHRVDDPEALYEHCLGAGDTMRASQYAAAAAARANAALAFDRAAALYAQALRLAPTLASRNASGAAPPPNSDRLARPSRPSEPLDTAEAEPHARPTRPSKPDTAAEADQWHEWQVGLATALANAGRPPQAGDAFLEAAMKASPSQRVELQRRAAEQLLIGGHIDRGLAVIDSVLDEVGMRLAKGPRAALASLLLGRLRLRWRGLDFVERHARDIAAAELLRVDTCWSVMTGLATVDMIRASDIGIRHLLLALDTGEPYRIARALAVESAFSAITGHKHAHRTTGLLARASALAAHVDQPHTTALVAMTAGMAALAVGRWKESATRCAQALEILLNRCTGVTWELNTTQNFLLGALLYQGELADVATRLPPLLADAQSRGNLFFETELCTRMNLFWLTADQPDEGERRAIDSIQRWSQRGFHRQHYSAALARMQTELYRGDADAAWAICEECRPALWGTFLRRVQIVRIEFANLRARCALAMAAAHPHDAEAGSFLTIALQEAAHIARERMPYADPIAALLQAAIAWLTRDAVTSTARLRAAIDGFDRAGMQLYAAAARACLGAILPDARDDARRQVDRFMTAQGVRNAPAMTRMLAPGFPHVS
jgi:eukaryotic-like serine/threonine-protein kinase